MKISEKQLKSEQREFDLVSKKVKEKKGDWLGGWLRKFSEKGDFWLGREKSKKDDWL